MFLTDKVARKAVCVGGLFYLIRKKGILFLKFLAYISADIYPAVFTTLLSPIKLPLPVQPMLVG